MFLSITGKDHSLDLDSIFTKYRLVKSLILNGPEEPHCLAFKGNSTLKRVYSNTDFIVNGLLKENHNLETLILVGSIHVEEEDDTDVYEHRSRRNLCTLLKCIPSLKKLEVENSCFWTRHPIQFTHSKLEALRLHSLHLDAHAMFFDWLSETKDALPNLKSMNLDLDYKNLPLNGISAIANGCPQLEQFKIRHTTISMENMKDLVTKFPRLKGLSFRQCYLTFPSNRWILIVLYIMKQNNQLRKLHMNGSTLLSSDWVDDTFLEDMMEFLNEKPIFPDMRSFKLFDVGDHRPSKEDITNLSLLFPNLLTFRADVPFHFILPDQLSLLKKLELRFIKVPGWQDFNDPITNLSEQTSSKLTDLSIWSCFKFPDQLIKRNAHQLKSLSINYPIDFPRDNETVYEMKALQTLEIRGLSLHAHSTCLSTLDPFIRMPLGNLRRLWLDALHKSDSELPFNTLKLLANHTPNLVSLHMTGFYLPCDSFSFLSTYWPYLESLVIRNSYRVLVNEEWLEDELYPFIEKHRHLRSLDMSVQSVELDKFDFINDGLDLLLSISDEDIDINIAKNLKSTLFQVVSDDIKERFWWIQSCNIYSN